MKNENCEIYEKFEKYENLCKNFDKKMNKRIIEIKKYRKLSGIVCFLRKIKDFFSFHKVTTLRRRIRIFAEENRGF